MSDPKLEEIAEAVAGKRCEYRGPGIVGPCAEFHEVCAATQRTNTLAILAALREAADAGRNEMLRWVVASLKEYPTGGGDREVMQEIKRISDAARREEEPKP